MAILLACTLAFSVPAFPAEKWLKVTSPNFELYTTAGEKEARAAILHFEQIQSFFLSSTSKTAPTSRKVRLIVFRSESEFRPYRPNEVAAAFYASTSSDDYIVMRDIGLGSYAAAVHEYFHLWVKNTKLPLWLNEGLAEFYSTVAPTGDRAKIGEFPPGHYEELRSQKWIDLETLMAAGHDSPLYNEKQRVGIFYAESWALAHMLNLRDGYRQRFETFAEAMEAGADAKATFLKVYGKTLPEVQKDLQQYIGGNLFRAALVPVKYEKSAEKVEVLEASPLESGMVLADLLANTKDRRAEAKKAYEQLARDNPSSAEVEAALAYFSRRTDEPRAEVKKHFARAAELGSKNARLYWDYANILHDEHAEKTAIVPLLQKAVEIQPDFQDARKSLASLLFEMHNYQDAIRQFQAILEVSKEQALPMYSSMAFAYRQIGQMEEARKSAKQALEYARTPEEISQAENLLIYVTQEQRTEEANVAASASPEDTGGESRPQLKRGVDQTGETVPPTGSELEPPQLKRSSMPISTIEGTLQQVDCVGKGARLLISSGGKRTTLAIVNPGDVILKGTSSITTEFACGPQKPVPVLVEYEINEHQPPGTAGIVRSIEFKAKMPAADRSLMEVSALINQGRHLSRTEAENLERITEQNPNDEDSRLKLCACPLG